jgi:ADP-L-glycero-D-manno-heptose 6-epimerase
MKSLEVLVTGGAGFIGSNLTLELEKLGHKVTALDNFSSGREKNLRGFGGNLIIADVSRPIKFNEKFDAIFHMGAITDPRYENDNEIYNKNIEGFRLMLRLAQRDKSKFIYASTANLYGNGSIPMKETQKKDIITKYGASKLKTDVMASFLVTEMYIVGLRYFNVFGQRESGKGRTASMIYHLYKTMKDGKNPRLFKFGEQKRDHIYVRDAVNATIKALDASSGIYNVGTGIATSFNELVGILNETLRTNLEPEYFDMPYDPRTYQANTQADTSLAEKELGFKARYSLRKGIEDYMKGGLQEPLS